MTEKHLALYRKYRPKSFSEVLGQDHIVSVLEKSVKDAKPSHAYLFVGSRGTGKTSVARIFAEALQTSPNDLYEIDAASNRGIDDIRELRDGVRVLPFDSKYKIYLIDEVHMLSKDAWGALLKTLEEPPKHVIFILATTELHKVPDTIISRCQVFTFKKPTDLILKNVALDIAGKEGYELDNGSAELIAILGDGSFRDTEGILQKVINFAKTKKITRAEVENITGAPQTELVNDYISAIIESDIEKGITAIHKAGEQNLDLKLFMKLVIQKFRLGIVLRYAPKFEKEMSESFSPTDIKFMHDLIKKDNKVMIRSFALSILLNEYLNIDNSFIASVPLELALIKIIESTQK